MLITCNSVIYKTIPSLDRPFDGVKQSPFFIFYPCLNMPCKISICHRQIDANIHNRDQYLLVTSYLPVMRIYTLDLSIPPCLES